MIYLFGNVNVHRRGALNRIRSVSELWRHAPHDFPLAFLLIFEILVREEIGEFQAGALQIPVCAFGFCYAIVQVENVIHLNRKLLVLENWQSSFLGLSNSKAFSCEEICLICEEFGVQKWGTTSFITIKNLLYEKQA